MLPTHAARALRLVAILGSALAMGCATFGQLNIISEEQELQMGAQFAAELDAELVLLDDPTVIAYIDSLGQAIAAVSQRNHIPYTFQVVDTDDVNAFAVPGGYLYVNRGLIQTADTESELAGVIGHEIGHVVGRHGARQLSQRYSLALLTSAALGEDPNWVAQVVADFVAQGAVLKYSRDMESEADAYGVQEVYDAGIDPSGLATFFDKLVEMRGGGQMSRLETFFATHPDPGIRASDVRARASALPPKAGLRRDSSRFHEIRERLPKQE